MKYLIKKLAKKESIVPVKKNKFNINSMVFYKGNRKNIHIVFDKTKINFSNDTFSLSKRVKKYVDFEDFILR